MAILRDLTVPDVTHTFRPIYLEAQPQRPAARANRRRVENTPELSRKRTAGGVVRHKPSPPEPKWFEGHKSRIGSIAKRSSAKPRDTSGVSVKGSSVYARGRSYGCGPGSTIGAGCLSDHL